MVGEAEVVPGVDVGEAEAAGEEIATPTTVPDLVICSVITYPVPRSGVGQGEVGVPGEEARMVGVEVRMEEEEEEAAEVEEEDPLRVEEVVATIPALLLLSTGTTEGGAQTGVAEGIKSSKKCSLSLSLSTSLPQR